MNGVINIYKEEGLTSFDVCKEIRKISGEKKNRAYRYLRS